MTVKTALISVSDKRGLVEFGLGLAQLHIEIYSTGNTYVELQQVAGATGLHEAGGQDKLPQMVASGVKPKRGPSKNGKNNLGAKNGAKKTKNADEDYSRLLKRVSEYTKQEEAFDGRLKTLDRLLFEGILSPDRGQTQRKIRNGNGTPLLDMVVVNFYPFQDAIKRSRITDREAIEKVDIGGPAMVRSAAKNYKSVLVVVDPDDYETVYQRLRDGKNTEDWRQEMALKAWRMVADYDESIAEFFEGRWAKTTLSQKK